MGDGVAGAAVLAGPRQGDQAVAAVRGVPRQALQRLAAGPHRRRLERQILGRIADQEEFGKQRDIGSAGGGLSHQPPRLFLVTSHIAHGGIGLDRGDDEAAHHGALLAPRPAPAKAKGM